MTSKPMNKTPPRFRQSSDGDIKPITPKHVTNRFQASPAPRDEIVFAPPSSAKSSTTAKRTPMSRSINGSSKSDDIVFKPPSAIARGATTPSKQNKRKQKAKDDKYKNVNPPSLTQETTIVFDPAAAKLQHRKQKERQKLQRPELKQDTTIVFDPKNYQPRLNPHKTIVFDPNKYRPQQKPNPPTSIAFNPQNSGRGGGSSIHNKNVGSTQSGGMDDKEPPVARGAPPPYLRKNRDGVPSQIFADVSPVPLQEQITDVTYATTFGGGGYSDQHHPDDDGGDGDGLLGDIDDEHLPPPPPPPPAKLLFHPNEATIEEVEEATLASSVRKKKEEDEKIGRHTPTNPTPVMDTSNNSDHDHRRKLHADYSGQRHENQTAIQSTTIPLTATERPSNNLNNEKETETLENQQQEQQEDELNDIPSRYYASSLLHHSSDAPDEPFPKKPSAVTTEDACEKYFKMLDVGVPMRLVKERMTSEGYDRTYLDNFKYRRVKWKQSIVVRRDDIWDGKHAKYYKMLSVGVPLEGVKRQMIFDGEPPASLDLDAYQTAKKKALAATRNCDDSTNDAQYTEYFNLLCVGLAMKDVKQHMKEDGVEPDILDDYQYKRIKDDNNGDGGFPEAFSSEQTFLSGVKEEGRGEICEQEEEEEESEYTKYFKLLKMGVPSDTVKATLEEDGLDPTYLDSYALDQSASPNLSVSDQKVNAIPKLEDDTPRSAAFEDAPDDDYSPTNYASGTLPAKKETHADIREDEYEKYFEMLRKGVPLRGVRNRMEYEGFDPNSLDQFQYERVRFKQSILYQPTREEREISQGEYAEYYKMLSVGVPLVAVKQRMEFEGWDPSTLDLELYNKAKARERAGARADYEGGGKDLEYSKYFELLSDGVILRDVKNEMKRDGVDPEILETYQYKRIQVSEEDMVLRGEHAKYFQMLSAGVPVQAVYQRMRIDGLHTSELDLELYERIKSKGTAKTLLKEPLAPLQEI